jgi:hypothetical protein
MAYEGGGGSRFKAAAGIVIAVLVAGVVGAIVKGGTREAISYANSTPSAIDDKLQSFFDENPSQAAMYAAMKEKYPQKYDEFIAGLSTVVRNKGDVRQYGFDSMRKFTLSLKKDFGGAPSGDIQLVLDKHVELMEVMSRSSEFYCGQFAFEGLSSSAQLSPDVLKLISEASALQINAAAAGRASPVVREDPTAADWDALSQNMLNLGTTLEEMQHVNEGTVSAMSQSRKCEVGKNLYEGIANLPTESAARVGAFLLIPDAAGGA